MRLHYVVCMPRNDGTGMADIVMEGHASEHMAHLQAEAFPGSYVITEPVRTINTVEWDIDWSGLFPVPKRRAIPKPTRMERTLPVETPQGVEV